jgi:hypothetical protein
VSLICPGSESRRARVFASSAFLKETPLYPLNPPQTNAEQFRETSEGDATSIYATSPRQDAIC